MYQKNGSKYKQVNVPTNNIKHLLRMLQMNSVKYNKFNEKHKAV